MIQFNDSEKSSCISMAKKFLQNFNLYEIDVDCQDFDFDAAQITDSISELMNKSTSHFSQNRNLNFDCNLLLNSN